MAAVVFALVALVVLALLGAVHRYVWRRFVGDTTAPGSTLRRVGTVAAFVLPLLSLGAMTSGRVGAPFWLQQVLAWPGFLWLACLLYLTLALLVGEVVRPLLLRFLARRDARTETAENGTAEGAASGTASGAPSGTTSGTPAAPASGALAGTAGEPRTRTGELVASRTAAAPSPSDPAVRTAPDPAAAAAAEPAAKADAEPATETDPESMAKDDTEPAAKAGTEPAESPSAEAPAAPAPALALGPSRRLFVSRVVGGAAAAAGLATVGYGTYGVLRGPSVQRITVPLAKLPRAAHGFRIAVVSDIHIGPILGRAHTRRIVDTDDHRRRATEAASAEIRNIIFNSRTGSPFDEKKVRQAVAALLDRGPLVRKVYQGTVDPLYSLIPTGFIGHSTPFFDTYPSPDPKRARKLLQQAGVELPVAVNFAYREGDMYTKETEELRRQMEKDGLFKVSVKAVEWTKYQKEYAAGKFDMYTVGWFPDFPDPDTFSQPLVGTGNVLHSGYSSKKMDQLIAATQQFSDRSRTSNDFKQMQALVGEDVPLLPLWQKKDYVVAKADVAGSQYLSDGTGTWRLWELSRI
ncbi:hypothetical protein SCALM49S_05476 [Streptomyces californicus]